MITGFVALLSSGLRGFKCHRSFIIIIMMLKNIFSVMSARLMLAAIDWNNSSREQCLDQAGKASTTAVYSQHLQSRQDQLCGDTDATILSGAQGQDHFA